MMLSPVSRCLPYFTMMISPEVYYEEQLKGKTKEQIISAIRGLKQEIGRLKNIMESPD